MLEVDFHSHTFFSNCGIHTHIELLTRAKELGMQGLAITDHGPALDSRITWPLFDRLHTPVEGIRFIKGIECNLLDAQGMIDIIQIPARFRPFLELVLVGFHPNLQRDQGAGIYTDMIITAIRQNPCIDVIAHPNEIEYPLDFERVVRAAREYGVALELNNSKSLHNRTTPESTRNLIQACKTTGCAIALGSDTHAIEELGLDDAVRPYLEEAAFPESLIVNSTAEKAFAFIEERKKNKW